MRSEFTSAAEAFRRCISLEAEANAGTADDEGAESRLARYNLAVVLYKRAGEGDLEEVS